MPAGDDYGLNLASGARRLTVAFTSKIDQNITGNVIVDLDIARLVQGTATGALRIDASGVAGFDALGTNFDVTNATNSVLDLRLGTQIALELYAYILPKVNQALQKHTATLQSAATQPLL